MRFSHDDGTRHLEFGSRVRDPEFGKLSSIGAVISEKKFALPVECLCEQAKKRSNTRDKRKARELEEHGHAVHQSQKRKPTRAAGGRAGQEDAGARGRPAGASG